MVATSSYAKDILEVLVSSVLAVISLIGNILVILVVYRNISLRTPVNILFVNLAFADMIAAVFVIPRFVVKLTMIHPEGRAGDVLCKFIRDLSWIGGQASAFTLVAIAFERHYAILYPHRRLGKLSKGKFRLIIIGSWIYGVTLELPSIYSSKFNRDFGICDEHWENKTLGQVYSVVLFVMNFVVPMVVLLFAYFGIVKHFWGKQASTFTNLANMALMRFRKRVTVVLLAVAVSYGVCWLPLPLFYMLYHVTGDEPVIEYNSTAYNFAILFVSLNSCLDPIVYSLQGERFGRALKRLLCCRDKVTLIRETELIRMTEFTLPLPKSNHKQNGSFELNLETLDRI
jgi:hypothetical protein